MRNPLIYFSLLAGCSLPKVDMPFDGDGDGLLSDAEEEMGTDPENPDSDDDGFTDGDEVDNSTDPLNPSEHPYTGGWKIDACKADMSDEGTGTDIDDVAPNFSLTDQYGDPLSLHDFCGKVVLIESSAFW